MKYQIDTEKKEIILLENIKINEIIELFSNLKGYMVIIKENYISIPYVPYHPVFPKPVPYYPSNSPYYPIITYL